MSSMMDQPARTGLQPADVRWPGADRRRVEQLGDAARAREGIDPVRPALTPAPPGTATAHDVAQLDAAGLERLGAIVARAAVDPAAVGQRVHVARTRRGLIIMLTVYTLGPDGRPVDVLGVPDVRHVIRPVTAEELPEAWRRRGDV